MMMAMEKTMVGGNDSGSDNINRCKSADSNGWESQGLPEADMMEQCQQKQ